MPNTTLVKNFSDAQVAVKAMGEMVARAGVSVKTAEQTIKDQSRSLESMASSAPVGYADARAVIDEQAGQRSTENWTGLKMASDEIELDRLAEIARIDAISARIDAI